MTTQIALQQHSINMHNFSVVSQRLPAINTEQLFFQNTSNSNDISIIYISRYSLCKLLCILVAHALGFANYIWFNILASRKVKQVIKQITWLQKTWHSILDQIHPLGIMPAQVNALLRCNPKNIFSFELRFRITAKSARLGKSVERLLSSTRKSVYITGKLKAVSTWKLVTLFNIMLRRYWMSWIRPG